jgi:UPF0176 protein
MRQEIMSEKHPEAAHDGPRDNLGVRDKLGARVEDGLQDGLQDGLEDGPIVVAALYFFAHLADYERMKDPLLGRCLESNIKGTILLAEEGINGTVAGTRQAIDNVLDFIRSDARLAGLAHKESYVAELPFHRMKVRLKKEIVTMGVPGTDPNQLNGTRVNAAQWNDLISDPDVLVIDTRNEYEIGIGTFENAVSPQTETFREFPAFVQRELDPAKHTKIAMFCTGGIRCEKASSYMLREGFPEVYHLDGGILRYLETVDSSESKWRGECFVFDDRVAVDANLAQGSYTQCAACRRPLSEEERASVNYRTGISCPHCIDKTSDDKKARLAERQLQVELAQARGEVHIGSPQFSSSPSKDSSTE